LGKLKKTGLSALFLFLSLYILSWQSELYGEYCNAVEAHEKQCASYNLAPFILIKFADFLHHFESAFIILSTIAIAWFTFELRKATFGLKDSTDKLWSAGESQIALIGRQTDLSEKQHGLAREEYFATHRPRVMVRRVSTVLVMNQPSTISFTIVNTGEAAVKNCTWNGQIMMLKGIGSIHTVVYFNYMEADSHNELLRVGEGIHRVLLDRVTLQPDEIIDIENGNSVLHVLGYVAYTDILDVTRRTGFFRYYDPKRQRFGIVNDPEYEYHD
jgi:hypothetical protein